MSRSNYSEDLDYLELGRWRGQVASAIRGKRGQALLREMLAALDAMPEKALIAGDLAKPSGEVCALGCLGKARGIDMQPLDPEDYDEVSRAFGVAPQLVREITWENDECGIPRETPEQRWTRLRSWVASQIKEPAQ